MRIDPAQVLNKFSADFGTGFGDNHPESRLFFLPRPF
jgi:hypothetical protein